MRKILAGSPAEVNLATTAVFPGIFLGVYGWRVATGNWASFDFVASALTLVSAIVFCACLALAPRKSLVIAAPIGFVGIRAVIAGIGGRGTLFWFIAVCCVSIVCLLALLDARLLRREQDTD